MAKKTAPRATFDEQLALFRFFLHELRLDSLGALGGTLNSAEYEGVGENGTTYFCEHIARLCRARGAAVPTEKLRLYDGNILRHTRQIGEKRGGLRWKYFQYVALLFTELYLDRYFSDPEGLCAELNAWLRDLRAKSHGLVDLAPYTPEKLNKLAFMCATGSGKTLLMHVNILQFLHYLRRARRQGSRRALNKVILLAPNEGMSRQHLEELALSSIPAALFGRERGFAIRPGDVLVIDMNKLKEEGKVKTVSVDSFEQDNLVLVDEGHRGLSGDAWYEYRSRLSAEGFAFEYSATFKQALNAGGKKDEDRALMEEYGKSILMDYSYKYFYQDGYGKDYRICNLRDSVDEEQRQLYLTGCLLSFYQQLKLFHTRREQLRDFCVEEPLLVFVGNRVTARTSKDEMTDVEAVLGFLDQFIRRRELSQGRIRAVLTQDTGLIDGDGNELFFQSFEALKECFGPEPDPEAVFEDILRLVFNARGGMEEPRLCLEGLRQVPGEIGLKLGESGEPFGVISIGNTAGLLKNCEAKGIVVRTEEFSARSLFQEINARDSRVKLLIGSRKFTEGWNSWRVSAMGLINFARGEGSQAIQLFGRGVRLKGYRGCLKRSRALDAAAPEPPRHMELLETLFIFGVRAQYMEDFKRYLEREDVPANDDIREFRLPAVSRFGQLGDRKLYVIRVKQGASFKKQGPRLALEPPEEDFRRYLVKNRTVIDCRSRVQTIDSAFSFALRSAPEELALPRDALPLLDYGRIFAELEQYKREKRYVNLCLVPERLQAILEADGWYGLLIPRSHLELDSLAKLEAAGDYAAMALKSYMDKFFRFARARWESQRLEYAPLGPDDGNLVREYAFTFPRRGALDDAGRELEAQIRDLDRTLREKRGLDPCRRELLRGRLTLFDFPGHLYAPLLCLERCELRLQVAPTPLNRGEMGFVELLKQYVDSRPAGLEGKALYLLRNRSRTGLGFFEAGNFYPDYLLWIDAPEKQYLSFIDPKGLLHTGPGDPKVEFHRTVKELEARLAPTADKPVVLNSFILSATPASRLYEHWQMGRAQREERNVYTLDEPDCVALMIEKILRQ